MSASAYPIHVRLEEVGAVVVFEASSSGESWSYLGVENADLAIDASELASGKLRSWNSWQTHSIPLRIHYFTTLENLFAVGLTHL